MSKKDNFHRTSYGSIQPVYAFIYRFHVAPHALDVLQGVNPYSS